MDSDMEQQLYDAARLIQRWWRASRKLLAFKSTVEAYVNKPEFRELKRRNMIVQEIVTTERTYVKSLRHVVTTYLQPLREMAASKSSKSLSDNEIRTIFGSIETILGVNETLLAQIEDAWNKWPHEQMIAQVFQEMQPYLKSYTDYVNGYDNALTTYNTLLQKKSSFRNFCEVATQHEDSKGLDLVAFLIMPVQRVPRYSLLLGELIKYTSEEHPDYSLLQDTKRSVDQVAQYVNEKKRHSEALEQVLMIQNSLHGRPKEAQSLVAPHRRFVTEGTLQKQCKDAVKPRHLFLFNDVLIYAVKKGTVSGLAAAGKSSFKRKASMKASFKLSPSLSFIEGVKAAPQYEFREMIKLSHAEFIDLPDMKSAKFRHSFAIQNREGRTFKFFCEHPAQKNKWATGIQEQIAEAKKMRQDISAPPAQKKKGKKDKGAKMEMTQRRSIADRIPEDMRFGYDEEGDDVEAGIGERSALLQRSARERSASFIRAKRDTSQGTKAGDKAELPTERVRADEIVQALEFAREDAEEKN